MWDDNSVYILPQTLHWDFDLSPLFFLLDLSSINSSSSESVVSNESSLSVPLFSLNFFFLFLDDSIFSSLLVSIWCSKSIGFSATFVSDSKKIT